jgi:hypothetical protein
MYYIAKFVFSLTVLRAVYGAKTFCIPRGEVRMETCYLSLMLVARWIDGLH